MKMVDVGDKPRTERIAVATARLRMLPETRERILAGKVEKGDVLSAARLAGVMAAKRTPDFVPLCHPIALAGVEVTLTPELAGLSVRVQVKTVDRTGVEMEALTAACAAALTVYDMCKSVDRGMVLEAVQLEHKSGGRSGTWQRAPGKQAPAAPRHQHGGKAEPVHLDAEAEPELPFGGTAAALVPSLRGGGASDKATGGARGGGAPGTKATGGARGGGAASNKATGSARGGGTALPPAPASLRGGAASTKATGGGRGGGAASDKAPRGAGVASDKTSSGSPGGTASDKASASPRGAGAANDKASASPRVGGATDKTSARGGGAANDKTSGTRGAGAVSTKASGSPRASGAASDKASGARGGKRGRAATPRNDAPPRRRGQRLGDEEGLREALTTIVAEGKRAKRGG